MLRYIAIIQATDRELLHRWTSGAKHRNYKSPILKSKPEAKKWLEENLAKYPKEQYFVDFGIIAFEQEESVNAERMFEKLMNVF